MGVTVYEPLGITCGDGEDDGFEPCRAGFWDSREDDVGRDGVEVVSEGERAVEDGFREPEAFVET